jgi:hypothetical protein
MGHSYIEFSDQFMQFRDVDVVIFMRCILAERARIPPARLSSSQLSNMLAFWMSPDGFPGPGCINLQLDQFIANDETRNQLLLLVMNAEERVSSYGDTVPNQYLNEVSEPSGYDFLDLPSERVLEVLRKFRRLLTGEHGK